MEKLCTDVMFKAIFGQNVKFVTYFLSSYFDIPYEELEGNVDILNPETPTEIIKSKRKTLDLKVKINDEIIIIEMNCYNKNLTRIRNLVYLMQEYSYQFKKKDEYLKGKRYHQINLCRYSYYEPKGEIHKVGLRDQYGNKYIENMESDFIDMDYMKKIMYNKGKLNKLDKWILVLLSKDKEELEKVIDGDIMDEETKKDFVETYDDLDKIEEIHEYFEKYEDQTHWDEDELEYVKEQAKKEGHQEGHQVGLQEGIEQGIEKGIEQGIEKGTIEIARKLKKENSTNEFISKITGLSIDEIEKLK